MTKIIIDDVSLCRQAALDPACSRAERRALARKEDIPWTEVCQPSAPHPDGSRRGRRARLKAKHA